MRKEEGKRGRRKPKSQKKPDKYTTRTPAIRQAKTRNQRQDKQHSPRKACRPSLSRGSLEGAGGSHAPKALYVKYLRRDRYSHDTVRYGTMRYAETPAARSAEEKGNTCGKRDAEIELDAGRRTWDFHRRNTTHVIPY